LVGPEMWSEQREALGYLPPQCGEREILDLVHLGVDAPVGRVGVAPLGADRHSPRLETTALEPGGEELLRFAIRAGGVEVADATVVRSVEDRVRLALQRGAVLLRAEVVTVTEVDVARTAERGETETQPADRQARPTQGVDAQLRRTNQGVACDAAKEAAWLRRAAAKCGHLCSTESLTRA